MSSADGSNIVTIDQTKKKIIGFIRGASFIIADIKVSVDLIVIDISKAALLVGMN